MAFNSITAGVQELKLKISAENTATKELDSLRSGLASLVKEFNVVTSQIAALNARIESQRAAHKKSSSLITERNALLVRQTQLEGSLTTQTTALAAAEKNLGDATKKTSQSFEKMAITMDSLSMVMNTVAKAISAPIFALDALSMKNAAFAIEMENLFNVTAGTMAKAGWAWTQEFQNLTGVSQTRARQMLGYLHTMITSMGQAEEKAMSMAKGLVKLGYDISSFYNVDVEVAFDKLMSGIVGLPRGLKTLGVVVTEEMVKIWALNNAVIKQGEVMTEAQEVWGRYNVILQQTRKAQGDLVRTITSPQNALRILNERIFELTVTIGKDLMGAYKLAIRAGQAFVGGLQALPEWLRKTYIIGGNVIAVIIASTAAVIGLTKSLGWLIVQLKLTAGCMALLKTASWWLFAIGVVITGITLAVGAHSKAMAKQAQILDDMKTRLDTVRASLAGYIKDEVEFIALKTEEKRIEDELSAVREKEDRRRLEAETRPQRLRYKPGEGVGEAGEYYLTPFTEEEFNKAKAAEAAVATQKAFEDAKKLETYLIRVANETGIVATRADEAFSKMTLSYVRTGKVGIATVGDLFDAVKAKVAEVVKSQVGFVGPEPLADLALLKNTAGETYNYILDVLNRIDLANLNVSLSTAFYNSQLDKMREKYRNATEAFPITELIMMQKAMTDIIKEAEVFTYLGKSYEMPFDQIVQQYGKAVSELVKQSKPMFAKVGLAIPEILLKIDSAWKTSQEAVEGVKNSIKQAARDARELGNNLQKALETLVRMKEDASDFNAKLKETLKSGYEDLLEKYQTGARVTYIEALDELYSSKKGLNPMQEAEKSARATWSKIAEDLTASKKGMEEFIQKQRDSVKVFYDTMQEKWDAIIRMEEMRVEAHAKANEMIARLDEAQAKGATESELVALYNEGMQYLIEVGEKGDFLISNMHNKAIEYLDETNAKIIEQITEIEEFLMRLPSLTEEEVNKVLGMFKVINGMMFKKGERRPAALLSGFDALPSVIGLASRSLKEFFSSAETGFSVNLTNAVDSFGLAIEDISTAYQKLERDNIEFSKSFLKSLKFLSAETKALMGAAIGGMISGAPDSAGGGLGGLFGSLLGGIKVNQKMPKGQMGPPAPGKVNFMENLIKGPIGQALGAALPFIGGLVGGLLGKLFHKKTAEEKEADRVKKLIPEITKHMAKFGKISEETAKSIATAMKTLSEHAATSKYFADVIEDVGVNQSNVNALWGRASEIFTDLKNKSLTVGDAIKAIGDSFTALLEGARKLGTEGSNAMVTFIAKAQASGQKIQEIIDYVDEQLGVSRAGLIGAAQGIEMMALGTVKGLEDLIEEKDRLEEELTDRLLRGYAKRLKQKELNAVMEKIRNSGAGFADDLVRIGNLAAATFSEMLKNGVSLRDAFESLGPTLDLLINRQELYGTAGSKAIDELLKIRKVQQANEELFDAIEGNKAAMTALYNIGGLNKDLFLDSQNQMLDYYNQLMKAGLTSEEAMALLVPTMEKIVRISKERGWAINDETAALINQAKVTGQLGEEQLSVTDAILGGFGKLIYALTGEIPKAFRRAAASLDGFAENADRREKEMEEGRGGRTREYGKAVDTVGRTSEDSTNRIVGGWTAVEEAIRGASDAAIIYADTTRDISAPSEAKSSGKNGEDEIHGSEGGTWKVNRASQLFRAHQGETVTIYKSEAAPRVAVPTSAASPSVQNTFTFHVSAVDASGVEKLFKKELIPLLEKYTKSENLLIHPNAVRRY